MNADGRLLGAIEAGGTKFLCAVGNSSGELLLEKRIPTGEPGETMDRVVAFFRAGGFQIAAFGIGSFGPVELSRGSSRFGFITSTPKTPWRNFDLLGSVRRAFDVPVGFDTDVNAAALAEGRWGAARDLRTFLYVTVGTGIGGGAVAEGSLLHGLAHPEMGHIRVPHDAIADPFRAVCPYHGDCLEGLASGRAIEARWGVEGLRLPVDHPAWRLEAEYLALACVNWICTLSPERILLGGGVMQQAQLFPLIRTRVGELLGGYLETPGPNYIVPSALGGKAGILGALALASLASGEKAGGRF